MWIGRRVKICFSCYFHFHAVQSQRPFVYKGLLYRSQTLEGNVDVLYSLLGSSFSSYSFILQLESVIHPVTWCYIEIPKWDPL